MLKLIPYELTKIWRKRSFLVFIIALLCLNVFMLWYVNAPREREAPLSAYKALSSDLYAMEEKEKYRYIAELKERLDGVATLSEILSLQARGDEMGASLAKQMLADAQGIGERYMQTYQSGDYLKYTNDLHAEKSLIDEIYAEMITVSGYDQYLDGVQSTGEALGGISVFRAASADDFSHENIEKSARDHSGLSSGDIRFFPSKGISMALENRVTDLLLTLAVFLFVGSVITEEKEKGLFCITRVTKNGLANCIGAKLLALWLDVLAVCLLLYSSNLVYTGIATGLCDFTAQLQSVSAYLESSLPITVLGFFALCLLTKAAVLFCFGAALTAVSVYADNSFLPQLLGVGWLFLNWLLYTLIPAYSQMNALKYLSFFGMMKTEQLYGEYLNLNIAGQAVSRASLSLLVTGVLCAAGVGLSFLLFCKGKSLAMRRIYRVPAFPFRPHGSLLRHEAYKLLITNKALAVLLAFTFLIGYRDLSRSYSPSAAEQYYAGVMEELEGGLTEEKKRLVLSERARFEEAVSQIERIEQSCVEGALDKSTAEQMKIPWYGVLTFYPAFQRVEMQYERVKSCGGEFIYDTGYRYLFGALDDSFIVNLLLLSLCMIFSFGNAMAMEETKRSWYLLAATARGRGQIVFRKLTVCLTAAGVMTLLSWISRWLSISRTYPMGEISSAAQNLPMYFNWSVGLPIWALLALAVVSQIVAVCLVAVVVLLLSYKGKSYLQASLIALLTLAAPLILSIMGIDFAKWFSVYPMYGWMSFAG